MADMTPLNDILNADAANAIPVQDNFQIIEAYINGTDLIRADGTEVMAADLDMDSNKVVNLADGVGNNDAVNKAQMEAAIAAVVAAAAPTAWTAPTLVNFWANYGGGYQTPEYRKIGDVVYLRGVIGAGTLGAEAFILPAGFRPPLQIQFEQSGTVDFVDVTLGGSVVPSGGVNTVVSLDGIQFSVST